MKNKLLGSSREMLIPPENTTKDGRKILKLTNRILSIYVLHNSVKLFY